RRWRRFYRRCQRKSPHDRSHLKATWRSGYATVCKNAYPHAALSSIIWRSTESRGFSLFGRPRNPASYCRVARGPVPIPLPICPPLPPCQRLRTLQGCEEPGGVRKMRFRWVWALAALGFWVCASLAVAEPDPREKPGRLPAETEQLANEAIARLVKI